MLASELKEYIFNNNKIEYILEDLGCSHIEFHPDKNYYTSTQPDGDNLMGVVICNNTYLNYFSYSRNIHLEELKDLYYLVREVKGFTFAEEMKYLHNLLGLNYTFSRNKNKEEVVEKINPLALWDKLSQKAQKRTRNVLDFDVLNENALEDFIPIIHIDLFKEGIMPWTIKKFGLCYSYKYKRTIFPHRYWLTGELIGYNARTSIENHELFDIKKYFISPGMPKEINLYGLWENYDTIQKAGYVVVYEAEKSVLKRDSLMDSTGVAISGHSLSDEQIMILLGLNVDIIISMDTDVNIQEVRNMCEKFWRTRRTYYTWDKHNLLPAKSSIADAKNKVFEFMMKYKIKYDENEHEKYEKGLNKK